jgi:hypothetical protein
MAGLDVRNAGPAADLQRVNDRVLLKMALDRKSYRQARTEVDAEDALKTPPSHAQTESSPGSASISVLEIHGTQVQIAVENGRAVVSVVHIDLQAAQIVVGRSQPARKDPLVLDLDGDGPDTTGAQGARPFDLQGQGAATPTSFVQGDSAFLVLDRNGNGSIDSGQELFGDQHGAQDGFAELARFDANQDGVIDAKDPVYSNLQLLFGDGHRTNLADAGIATVDLGTRPGYELPNGDAVLRQGNAYRSDGSRVGAYAMGLQQFEA